MNVRIAAIVALSLASPALAQVAGPVWIRGRVNLPPGTPTSEPIEVHARRGDAHVALAGSLLAGAHVDSSGAFEFEVEPRDPGFFLVLESRWLELRPLWIEPRPGESGIEIVLAPALRGYLRGRFVAPESRPGALPIRGSWVWIEGAELRAAEVDADGEFELCGPAAEMGGALCARPHEFAPLLLDPPEFRDGELCELVLPLLEPARVRGRLVDSAGTGIAGATLSFWRGGEGQRPLALNPWGDLQAITSGLDGSFDAQELPPGDLTLRVEDPRWRALGFQVRGLLPGEERSGLELVLLRGASLRGLVQDEFGQPVAGARVTAGMREGAGGLMVATTDAQGRYAFDAALPGEYVLSASGEGHAAHSEGALTLHEGAREQANLVLGRGSLLHVALGDHEAPVHVRVIDALGFLRADQRVWQGELELVLPPGRYRVALLSPEGARTQRTLVLTGSERAARQLRM